MPSPHDALPDMAVGHHPVYGIVAANPHHLAAGAWMLQRLDFLPVPGEPTLHSLIDQHRDGPGRATRAVTLLRQSGFLVHADAEFDPPPAPDRAPAPRAEPEVAFAEHPQLGIVAALDDRASMLAEVALTDLDWRHDQQLDIYVLPAATDRNEALGKVADATVTLHRSGTRVAVHPHLAQDVAGRPRPGPAPAAPRDHGPSTPRTAPISAAALAASPARAALPGQPPNRAPAAPAPTGQLADPRIAYSRNR